MSFLPLVWLNHQTIDKTYTMGVTSWAGTVYPFGGPDEFTSVFVAVPVAQSLVSTIVLFAGS